ncbi:MAG: hypothetical protein IT357_05635 [Gemmatimonadaceae bacterium]|nr:hypothetical protein [Gemmatimonadaceae bacterium]
MSARPILSIPASTAQGTPRFATATWATRLSDGRIAIADGGDAKVRLFAATGVETRALGREGRGPGEFSSLGWISTCGGDSLWVWDFVQAKMSVLHPSSGYTRAFLSPEMRSGDLPSCSPAREFAFTARFRRLPTAQPVLNAVVPSGGDYRVWIDTFDVQTFDANAGPMRSVSAATRRESISGRAKDGRFASFARPLGLTTSTAFLGDRLVIAQSDSGRVRFADPAGATEREFRLQVTRRAPSLSEYGRALDDLVLSMPGFVREQFKNVGALVPPPDHLPTFHAMFADPDGLLWFVMSPPGAVPSALRVYRPTGDHVASLAVPASLVVFEIGRDYLLGRSEDEDGEQAIVLYRLTRR